MLPPHQQQQQNGRRLQTYTLYYIKSNQRMNGRDDDFYPVGQYDFLYPLENIKKIFKFPFFV